MSMAAQNEGWGLLFVVVLVWALLPDRCTSHVMSDGDVRVGEHDDEGGEVDEEGDEAETPAAPTFGGHPCAVDCSGHAAGFLWARDRGKTNIFDCYDGGSRSFQDGCTTYFNSPRRDPTIDDQGRPIARR